MAEPHSGREGVEGWLELGTCMSMTKGGHSGVETSLYCIRRLRWGSAFIDRPDALEKNGESECEVAGLTSFCYSHTFCHHLPKLRVAQASDLTESRFFISRAGDSVPLTMIACPDQ